MKFRLSLATLLLISVSYLFVALAEPLDTYQTGWNAVRAPADEDGATFAAVYNLALNGGDFASKDSSTVANGGPFRIPAKSYPGSGGALSSQGGAILLTFAGSNYNNVDDTFSFNVVGWSRDNGMLQNICEGSGVLGTQAVDIYPDGTDAKGSVVDMTGVVFDLTGNAGGELYFTKTDVGVDVVAGMLAYVTGTNITSGYYQVTSVDDDDNIEIAVTATDDTTDATVQINPAFWADTLTLDETTKWRIVAVQNSGDNEVAQILIDRSGLEWIQVVVYDADAATGEEAGNISSWGRLY